MTIPRVLSPAMPPQDCRDIPLRNQQTSIPLSSPMTSPEDVLVRFADAWEARDGEAIGALFVEDPEFVNVTGMWWHTPTRIALAHDFGFREIFRDSYLRFIKQKVRLIGDNAAVVHGRWRVTGQTTGKSDEGEPRKGILIFVMEKVGEEWKAVAAQNTDIVAGHESLAVIDGETVPQFYGGTLASEG